MNHFQAAFSSTFWKPPISYFLLINGPSIEMTEILIVILISSEFQNLKTLRISQGNLQFEPTAIIASYISLDAAWLAGQENLYS